MTMLVLLIGCPLTLSRLSGCFTLCCFFFVVTLHCPQAIANVFKYASSCSMNVLTCHLGLLGSFTMSINFLGLNNDSFSLCLQHLAMTLSHCEDVHRCGMLFGGCPRISSGVARCLRAMLPLICSQLAIPPSHCNEVKQCLVFFRGCPQTSFRLARYFRAMLSLDF